MNDTIPAAQPFPTRWALLLGFAGAAMAALTISAQIYLSMRGHGHSAARIFVWQLAGWGFWALLAPTVLRQAGRLRREGRRLPRHVPGVAAIGLLIIAVHILVISQLTAWIQPFVPVVTYGFEEALIGQFGSLFVVDLFVYVTLLATGSAFAAYQRTVRLELRDSQLQTELARAHLEALRLEIQPHFLFNTLNSIAALIRRGTSDQALEMLLGLSELMRTTLDRGGENLVTLGAEIDFAGRYVDLQRHRFADRLEVQYDVGESCREMSVPTFLLQPLVENALHHGVARTAGACRLEIGARVEAGRLRVWVADRGAGLPPGFDVRQDAGTGLGNIRARLERLYGSAARLDVRTTAAGETVAEVLVPCAQLTEPVRATA
jgi:two-component system, LytTR family, sensor kinase